MHTKRAAGYGRQFCFSVFMSAFCIGMLAAPMHEAQAAPVSMGETGSVNLSSTPHTVILQRSYTNPVVIAQPITPNGADASVIRITNVQSNQFTLYVDEAPNHDGNHTTETVSYLVLEAGRWRLSNGSLIEVGKLSTSATVGNQITNDSWAPVGFTQLFPSVPAVFSQVQTNQDASWVKTRQQLVTATGFQVALEEEEAATTSHGTETIGWIAMQPGVGLWDAANYDYPYAAGNTANAVTHNWYRINLGQNFATAFNFMAQLATYDGTDSAALRYQAMSAASDSIDVKVEEDTTFDAERDHTTESVSYLAIETLLLGNGILQAIPLPSAAQAVAIGPTIATKQAE